MSCSIALLNSGLLSRLTYLQNTTCTHILRSLANLDNTLVDGRGRPHQAGKQARRRKHMLDPIFRTSMRIG
ncbi:hypothetical protein F5B18DRAFT_300323 [Nemania serpens]|nr:hypothetical protein F5B18DRAFT_300323 [Nemania serpens]